MGVDSRTRVDGEALRCTASEFFDVRLVALAEGAGDRLAPWFAERYVRPLTVDVDGELWSLDHRDGVVIVEPGASGAKVARLTCDQLNELIADIVTPMAWLATGELGAVGARLEHLLDWWVVLRALIDNTTPHITGAVEIVDADGAPIDLHRSFSIDDDPAEMRGFLAAAGYLHIAGVFTEDEMAAVSRDMDAAVQRYHPGDGRSWWAKLNDGSDALVRMQGFDQESEVVAGLVEDERLWRLAEITGEGHSFRVGYHNRIEALFKPIGVVEGISDVPWHKDCSLGRHSYDCCDLNVGISVTGADAASGQLRVVAGSHRALIWPAPTLQPGLDLPVVDLVTQTGDITVHLSCTLHMAQPPVAAPRRVMYSSMKLPELANERAQGWDRMSDIRESAAVTVSQPQSQFVRK